MKVLMTADAVGGVWTYALDLARGLSRCSVETVLAVLGPLSRHRRAEAGAVPGLRLIETGLPLDWMAESADEVLGAGRAVAALADEHSVDIVHLNSPALAAGGAFGRPVVGVCHSCVATWWAAVRGGALPDDFGWRTKLVRRGYGACDALIAPSRAFAEATRDAYGLSRAPIVVSNGRAKTLSPTGRGRVAQRPGEGERDHRVGLPPSPHPLPSESRAYPIFASEDRRIRELPSSEERAPAPFILTAGRLWDDGKNVATLDRAAALIGVPVRAAGATSGPNGTSIELTHVEALGSLPPDDLAHLMDARPVFTSLALYEPFGLAVLEAAQRGCALVLSDIATFRELWKGAALFVPATDDQAAAAAMRSLMSDPKLRSEMGEAARERAARYTVDGMTAGTLDVYASVLARTSRRRAPEVAA